MHKLARTSWGEGSGVIAHHCGGGPNRASGHKPWSTNPNLPFRPEHCIAALSPGPRQNSGDHESASV